MTTLQSPLKIDVDSVIRKRLGSKARRIPRWVTRLIERIIRQDDLNGILERTAGLEGAAFCHGVLNDLDITYSVEGQLPDPSRRNVIIVSNHPLGALDGITLIDWATEYYGHEVRFMVNDLLMAVEPLKPVFVPVNKFGRQDRDSARSLDDILNDRDTPLIIFPAGLCSRKLSGRIADLPWKKTFVSRAIESHRDIIPIYFKAKNSTFFYNFADIRRRLMPKVNLEMALLPREIFNCRGRKFVIRIGQSIAWSTLKSGQKAAAQAESIRNSVYNME